MSGLTFQYNALDAQGRPRSGAVAAPNKAAAFRSVSSMGLTPVNLREASQRDSVSSRSIKANDLAQFTYELGVLLQTAVPIGEGLRAIAEQERNPSLRALITHIASRIEAGASIAESLREHERVFGTVYVETIAAAEQSGNLIKALGHLSEMLEWNNATAKQFKQALMYPLIVVIVLILGTGFLLAGVVPRFVEMFEQRGLELPLLTRVLRGIGVGIREYWWLLAIGIPASVFGIRRAWSVPSARVVIDGVLHRVPLLGQILVCLAVSRFSRVLGISISSGIGLIEGLRQSGRACGRPLLRAEAEMLAERTTRGTRLSESLKDTTYLPVFAKRMLSAGEESAEIPRMCDVITRHYEREATYLSKNIGTLVEPVLIALLTVIVLLVALGIFLPMWDAPKLMK